MNVADNLDIYLVVACSLTGQVDINLLTKFLNSYNVVLFNFLFNVLILKETMYLRVQYSSVLMIGYIEEKAS